MLILASLEAIALVAIVQFFLRHLSAQQAAHNAASELWREERRELLERIQRPEIVPVRRATSFEEPEQTVDDIALVGTIHYEQPEE